MTGKIDRLDRVLVQLGHFDSRAGAQAAIAAGRVKVNGKPMTKPSQKIALDARIEAEPAHPWVSRAGLKLAHGLDAFAIDPAGRACLDIGASTGGFTQVLLARGARHVVAVDVGRDQLHPSLRADGRVISLEGCDARQLTSDQVGEAPQLIVCDASFISLHKLLGGPLALARPGADLVTLFKPQFEVGREHVGKGGIVSDRGATARAEAAFVAWLEQQGWQVKGGTDSPIKGGDGNAERLIWAVKSPAD